MCRITQKCHWDLIQPLIASNGKPSATAAGAAEKGETRHLSEASPKPPAEGERTSSIPENGSAKVGYGMMVWMVQQRWRVTVRDVLCVHLWSSNQPANCLRQGGSPDPGTTCCRLCGCTPADPRNTAHDAACPLSLEPLHFQLNPAGVTHQIPTHTSARLFLNH